MTRKILLTVDSVEDDATMEITRKKLDDGTMTGPIHVMIEQDAVFDDLHFILTREQILDLARKVEEYE